MATNGQTTAVQTRPSRLARRTARRRARSAAAPGARRDARWAYLFVAPFFVVFAVFGLYPLGYALLLSFTDWHGAGVANWIGLDNYRYLLGSGEFWASLGRSGVIWLLVVPAQAVLSLALAVLLSRPDLRGRGLFRTAFIVPFVTPLIAMAEIWIVMYDDDFGLVNAVLNFFGLPDVGWLTTTAWAKPTLALLVLWKTTGFAIILMLAGLQAIDRGLYEAAEMDGAGAWTKFWRVTVPLMRRTIAFYVVTVTLIVFQMFAEPYVVTRGGPYNSTTTAGLYLYDNIRASDFGTGAANSFLLVLLVFGLSLLAVRLLRSKEETR
jgi:ABC-type sugar transport system permease subunit